MACIGIMIETSGKSEKKLIIIEKYNNGKNNWY
jgi:hypothetical protein